ncbi:PREDICTED: cysteine proteinase inhibitor 7 [Tarenaya hassleriana]|uniref:cysteine proteinase inhibitor 7 n=1 Tax=Tarenaya hassleriana TaxID=28532 RepID=UPI00053C9D67|nr:PREDICTED: cysteine proteinase inhibitor 7 [Tarenaya hassleriana]
MGRSAVLKTMICATVVLFCGFGQSVICSEEGSDNFIRAKLGGVGESRNGCNSAEIEDIARFAVQEHNKRENAFLEFAGVLKATEQAVAGKLYHLTLEAIEAGSKKVYEAKVWVKPWMNFHVLRMELEVQRFLQDPDQQQFEFQHYPTSYLRLAAHRVAQHYGLVTMVTDSGSDGPGNRILVRKTAETRYPLVRLSEIPVKQPENVLTSDLGLKRDGSGFEWRTVPTNDPQVQEAAKHAVKSIQQRSNSLYPYKLLDIILARAKTFEDRVKFELVLKIQRGSKLEKFMVEVMKNQNGSFF